MQRLPSQQEPVGQRRRPTGRDKIQIQKRIRPVNFVPDQRAPKPLRVRPDLMLSSRLRHHADQGESRGNAQRREMRHRRLPALRHHRRLDKHRTGRVVAERLIHGHRLGQLAHHHRQILLAGLPLHHRSLQPARHRGIFREHHDAAGLPVEAEDQMHHRQTRILPRCADQTRPRPRLRRMAHDVARLVYHQQLLVLENNPRLHLVRRDQAHAARRLPPRPRRRPP